MSKPMSWPDGEAADDEREGVVHLARAAFRAPAPPPEAESASRERVLAQFREAEMTPRHLHETAPVPLPPAPLLKRVLRRLLGQ